MKHKVATPYHPQTSGQFELSINGNKDYLDEGSEFQHEGLIPQVVGFIMGIQDSLQDNSRDVPLSLGVWKGMPPPYGNRIQGMVDD